MRPPPPAEALVVDVGYQPLKQYLIDSTGLAYYSDKDRDLAEKIGKRLAVLDESTCSAYLSLLKTGEAGEAELDELVADLTVGETYFFRLEEQFQALRRLILPGILERNAGRRQIRIWSAGCAAGPEVYSLSIVLRRELAAELAGWDVSIVGTDINRRFLAQARAGEFGEWALRGTDDAARDGCFLRSAGGWRIRDEYREGVSFQYHNLVKHPYPSLLHNLAAFDVILCRNVMIYFNREVIRECLDRFRSALVEGGWLLVGHAETNVDLFRDFRNVSFPGTSLFQKTTEPAAMEPLPSFSGPWQQPPVLPELPPLLARSPLSAAPPPPARPAPPARSPLAARIRELTDAARWEEAAQICRALIAEDGLDPVGHFFHALVLEQMGQAAQAEGALNRAIYVDRNFALAHYHRGLLLQKGRDVAGAVRSFRNVIDLLRALPPATLLREGDGISAADLLELAQMQLEVLGKP